MSLEDWRPATCTDRRKMPACHQLCSWRKECLCQHLRYGLQASLWVSVSPRKDAVPVRTKSENLGVYAIRHVALVLVRTNAAIDVTGHLLTTNNSNPFADNNIQLFKYFNAFVCFFLSFKQTFIDEIILAQSETSLRRWELFSNLATNAIPFQMVAL